MSNNFTLPTYCQPIYTHEQIQKRIIELGNEITPWAISSEKKSGRPVLAVCVLRGGVFFFADVVRQINTSLELSFCRTWAYTSVVNEQKRDSIRYSLDEVDAGGKHVLLIDDICDSGGTLKKMHSVLMDIGAIDVKAAVFIYRTLTASQFIPDWWGFKYDGPEWFVGYGMEDKNAYRNYPGLAIIKKDIEPK